MYHRIKMNQEFDERSLSAMTVPQLRSVAKSYGIRGIWGMIKQTLIDAIMYYDTGNEPVNVSPDVKIHSKQELIMAQPTVWRTAVYDALKQGKITFKSCDINSIFSSIKHISAGEDKDSASETIVIIGNMRIPKMDANDDIVMKISFPSFTGDNSAVVEHLIYRDVVAPLVTKRYTPHLMMYIGFFKCDDFDRVVASEKIQRYMRRSLLKMAENDLRETGDIAYDYTKLNMLVIEQGRGMPLNKWMQKSRSWQEWQCVLFQILWTLTCFWQVGLQHNDLHSGNIWIDPVTSTFMYYSTNKKTAYKIPTSWFVKIYDFDLSTKHATKYNYISLKNTRLDSFCAMYGVCNRPNQKYDLFKVLSTIYASIKTNVSTQPVQVIRFIEEFVSRALLNEQMAFTGSLCRLTKTPYCKAIYPTKDEMSSPRYIMRHAFADKRVPYPKDTIVYTLPA